MTVEHNCAQQAAMIANLTATVAKLQAEITAQDRLFAEQLRNVERQAMSALASSDKAIDKSSVALEKRLEGQNEFRSAMTDQQRNYPTREEVTAQIGVVIAQIQGALDRVAKLELGAIRLEDLKTSVDIHAAAINRIDAALIRIEATKSGGKDEWQKIALAVTLTGGVLAIVFRFVNP